MDTENPTAIVAQVETVSSWKGFFKLLSSQKNPRWLGLMGIAKISKSAIPNRTRQTISRTICHLIRLFDIFKTAILRKREQVLTYIAFGTGRLTFILIQPNICLSTGI